MSQVPTVRGPVEVADLGPTYMHEHIFVRTADVQQNYPRIITALAARGRLPVLAALSRSQIQSAPFAPAALIRRPARPGT